MSNTWRRNSSDDNRTYQESPEKKWDKDSEDHDGWDDLDHQVRPLRGADFYEKPRNKNNSTKRRN